MRKMEKELPVLYKRKEECCGCTACYAICPKEAISMVEDEEGFEYPQIDESKCVRCYQCLKVCPFKVAKASGMWYTCLLYTSNADISIALKQYKKQIKYIHSREKIVQEYLMGNLTAYLWSTLVKRALYNELRFEQLKIGEDALMLCRLYCRAEKLVVFQSNGYHYLERIDSASSKRSFSILKMWLWGVKEQSKIVEDNCPSCLVYMNYKKTIYAPVSYTHLDVYKRQKKLRTANILQNRVQIR